MFVIGFKAGLKEDKPIFWLRRSLLKTFHVLYALIKYEDWYVTVLAYGITNLMRLFVSLLVIPDLAIIGRVLWSMYVR